MVMTQDKDSGNKLEDFLLLAPTDTKMAKVLDEAINLLEKTPEILDRIRADQEADGKEEKWVRILDQRWVEKQTLPLPLEELLTEAKADLVANDLELKVGRPRLRPEVVYIFLALRGNYASVSSQNSWDRFSDSLTLRYYLQPYMNRLPGRTTVLENLNIVSAETRSFLLNCQLKEILNLGLDDFREQTVDSTSVHANSAWPTDIHLIIGFANEAYRFGQRLADFDLPNFHKWYIPEWLKQLEDLEFKINLESQKKNGKKGKRFQKLYQHFLDRAENILDYLSKEHDRLDEVVCAIDLMPSRRYCLKQLWERLALDLGESYVLLEFTADRVLGSGDTTRDEHEQIYSISDRAARFIKKGGRDTVFGYKIQLSRSKHGFITSVLVPEGNVADSSQLVPMVSDHSIRTGVIPQMVSVDDGYSSAKGREITLKTGVLEVSISGSKGKKITPEEDWSSEKYQKARNDRSAVESLMFTGKHSFEFGRFHRRGIDAVREEMLEKVIAYNFWRISYERSRQKAAAEKKRQRLRAA